MDSNFFKNIPLLEEADDIVLGVDAKIIPAKDYAEKEDSDDEDNTTSEDDNDIGGSEDTLDPDNDRLYSDELMSPGAAAIHAAKCDPNNIMIVKNESMYYLMEKDLRDFMEYSYTLSCQTALNCILECHPGINPDNLVIVSRGSMLASMLKENGVHISVVQEINSSDGALDEIDSIAMRIARMIMASIANKKYDRKEDLEKQINRLKKVEKDLDKDIANKKNIDGGTKAIVYFSRILKRWVDTYFVPVELIDNVASKAGVIVAGILILPLVMLSVPVTIIRKLGELFKAITDLQIAFDYVGWAKRYRNDIIKCRIKLEQKLARYKNESAVLSELNVEDANADKLYSDIDVITKKVLGFISGKKYDEVGELKKQIKRLIRVEADLEKDISGKNKMSVEDKTEIVNARSVNMAIKCLPVAISTGALILDGIDIGPLKLIGISVGFITSVLNNIQELRNEKVRTNYKEWASEFLVKVRKTRMDLEKKLDKLESKGGL